MIGSALVKAFGLLVSGDSELYQVIFLSFWVSGMATVIAGVMGVWFGTWLALSRLSFSKFIINVVHGLMAIPPVVIGLLVYITLSHSGPLGKMELLFTPTAMMIAQLLLAFPIITGLTVAAINSLDKSFREELMVMGAPPLQLAGVLISEARSGIYSAVITAFGRVLGEVGAVMMVGGNIRGYTRVMTTAITLDTRQGEYERGLALGFVLILLSLALNILLGVLREEDNPVTRAAAKVSTFFQRGLAGVGAKM